MLNAARKQMTEMLWLLYYNRVLLKQNIITPEQFQKMESAIRAKKGACRTENHTFPAEFC